ncbi:MAG: hypothetical protein COA71_03810 [SAR86 cluster bacterium]|uniref:Polynucleotide kinase PNKP phosphatase domain-containing protein n=1 Tax=SAR86 cluster bacterium TaxID=2030880 RepID=A0A2A5CFU7_9GAMM|nr:hypothetical protein [Gammaproteobacteria bacterium AH-315-E17]PCJ42642.1 MAG: hypothetical protein COA71_03810 [SAR86 cluster bacterium]
MKTILFDIDGTLADNWHRQHLVQAESPDWDSFFEMMSEDSQNVPVVELFKALQESQKYRIILVSARPERYRIQTESWLDSHDIVSEHLYMREDGDRRPDFKVKKDMLDKILEDKHDIIFVVDDRTQTVKMWRENNITCLQCADHDF